MIPGDNPDKNEPPPTGCGASTEDYLLEEGGEVEDVRDATFKEKEHRARTAKTLALLLVWILAITIVIQYLATFAMLWWGKDDKVDSLGKIFNAWLPVIAGLVSSAVTYYFTRRGD